jgi:hypothetical protein
MRVLTDGMRLAAVAAMLLGWLVMVLPWDSARADPKPHELGNVIRMVVMVPLLTPGTADIARIMPVGIDLLFDSQEAKDSMINSIPRLQDAYLQGTYGKVFTNWGYDRIQALLKTITDRMVGDDLKDQVHLAIRLNIKQQ